MKKIAIIGIGNTLRKDDGIGIVILKILKNNDILSENIELIDGGTSSINLIHILHKYDIIIFIDAMNLDRKVGESRLIDFENFTLKFNKKFHSFHSFDTIEIINLSKKINKSSTKFYFFGIQPKDISFGTNLTKELSEKIDSIIENLVKNIKVLVK